MKKRPLILFFTKFFNDWPDLSVLDQGSPCDATIDVERMVEADAVVFHLPDFENFDQLTKSEGQLWVAWSMESPQICPIMGNAIAMARFDLKMTYQQDADVWVPYLADVNDNDLLRPPKEKTQTAPVVRFQSNSFDSSGRNHLAKALMVHVKTDSYGMIDNNRTLPHPDCGRETMLETLSRYKFTLAFENADESDYVTEKFYNPLMAGSVPIYLGAPNVAELAPGENCFINAADFNGVEELGAYINFLDGDDDAYQAYLNWKTKGLSPTYLAHSQSIAVHPFLRLSAIVAGLAGV